VKSDLAASIAKRFLGFLLVSRPWPAPGHATLNSSPPAEILETPSRIRPGDNPAMKIRPGPWSMLAGYITLSAMPVLVRLVGEHGWMAASTTAVRFGLGLLAVLLLVLFGRQRLHTAQPLVLLLRGAFGGLSVLTYFFAVQRTGAGMGTLLNYTHSIWANLLGLMLFRQRPDRRFWPMLALAMAGLWLVINPSFSHLEVGKLYGLFSGILGGAAILCVKRLRQTDSALTIMTSFSGVGLCFALLLLPFDGVGTQSVCDVAAWAMLVGIAALSFGGQMFFTYGYRETSVALGSLLSLLVPTLATLSGWALLSEPLTLRYGLGAALVLAACGGFGWLEKH
jgi:drug/metabolite transporter (DMT)-like permease